MAKKMIIKGVGTFMAKRYKADNTAEVITLGTLQDLKIDLSVELDDIFGGDGLFAIDTLVKSKSIEISATDAKFDLDALQLMMGSVVQEQVEDTVWVLNEQDTITGGEVSPEFKDTVATGTNEFADFDTAGFQVRLKDKNTLLKVVAGAPADGTEVQWDSVAKKLKFHASNNGKDVVFNYRRTETVDKVDLLVDEVPFPVSVVHHGSFIQKDGTFQGVETELYACRAKGTFSINAARSTASASQIALQIIDPERPDGKLGTIKRYAATTRV